MKQNDYRWLTERYAQFMGGWMAGAVVGRFISKIVYFALLIWILKTVCASQ